MQCYRSMLFRLSADDNGAVRVVDHVVADAAQDGAPERAHARGCRSRSASHPPAPPPARCTPRDARTPTPPDLSSTER